MCCNSPVLIAKKKIVVNVYNIFYKAGHVLIGKENVYNGLKFGVGKSVGSRLLSIQNVTSEDEGDYICEVTVHSGHKNHATYKLKAFSKFYKYLMTKLFHI